ncbi:hypothetical protein BsWGS_23302 [Bradybaena similaris]
MPTLVVDKVSWAPYLTLSMNHITSVPEGSLPAGLGGIDFEGNPITNIGQQVFVGSSNTLTILKFTDLNLEEFPFALFYLSNLQHLSIKDSRIQQWDISIWFFLGNRLQDVTLVNVGVTSWPEWIQTLPLLYNLEFSSAIVSIPDNAFEMQKQNMTSLTLKNVTMTSTGNIFTKLSGLRDLNLDNNRISQLSGLPNFGKLSYLSIVNNSISNATHLSIAFRAVGNSLVSLYMDGNKLTVFPDLSFMTVLDTVHISGNLIHDVNTGAIPASLSFLALENNRLTTLTSVLKGGTNLNTLRLRANLIATLVGTHFPANVADIDVSLNRISTIRESCFPPNSKLEMLRLDFNPISTISASAFDSLIHLNYLSMTSTSIARLPLALGSLRSLTTLDLRNNDQLVCTCEEKALRVWFTAHVINATGNCGLTTIDFFLRSLSADCPP